MIFLTIFLSTWFLQDIFKCIILFFWWFSLMYDTFHAICLKKVLNSSKNQATESDACNKLLILDSGSLGLIIYKICMKKLIDWVAIELGFMAFSIKKWLKFDILLVVNWIWHFQLELSYEVLYLPFNILSWYLHPKIKQKS